jgi:hypothetical protein
MAATTAALASARLPAAGAAIVDTTASPHPRFALARPSQLRPSHTMCKRGGSNPPKKPPTLHMLPSF